MEETNGNGNAAPTANPAHAHLDSYESQPVRVNTPAAASSGETTTSSAPSDDVDMSEGGRDDDAGQPHASVAAAIDEEQKQEDATDDTDGSTVVLHLKFLHRDRVTLRCAPSIVIADLKQLVRNAYTEAVQADSADTPTSQESEANPATQPLRLIYKGKVLKDDQTLASYNFVSEDTVHAVFSRTSVGSTTQDSSEIAGGSETHAGSSQAASSDARGPPGRSENVFVFENEMQGGIPEISRLITSVVNSAMNSSDESETTATIRIFPMTPQNGGNSESSGSTAGTAATTTSTSTQSSTAHSQRGASIGPTSTISSVLPSVSPTPNPAVSAPATAFGGSASLLNQAAALRRSIPALELAPLSRPTELSEEMYDLGNVMRESGDTYLAIHRQLQFLATRFQQENHLNASERARLRSRVQQLIPVMENVSRLSTGVSLQLTNSPYGPGPNAMPTRAQSTPSTTPVPLHPTATTTTPPPLAQAVQNIFSEIFGAAAASQPGTAPTPVGQALNGLPSFLGNLVTMATSPQTSSPPNSAHVEASGPSQVMPFRSFAPKLLEFVNANPSLVSASLSDFLRAALPMIDRHIATCYSAGSEDFVRNGVVEVEDALRLYEQTHQRVYTSQESRRSIIRLAMQELAHISLPIAPNLDARSAELQAWMRRSCSHLFAELCEIAPTALAARMTGLIAAQLLSGNDQWMNQAPSTTLDRVATETTSFLQRRFQLS